MTEAGESSYSRLLKEFHTAMGQALGLLPTFTGRFELRAQRARLSEKLSQIGQAASPPRLDQLEDVVSRLADIISMMETLDDLGSTVDLLGLKKRHSEANKVLLDLRLVRVDEQAAHEGNSRRAAERAGETLKEYFGDAYKRERRSAALLRLTAFLLLFATVALAAWVSKLNDLSWQGEVAHLAVSVPLLGGAYYASYEARDHRRYARNEHGWQARMKSFDNFCEPLPDELRNEVRTAFAKRLYTDPPDFGPSKSLADASQKTVEQFLAFARAFRGGDATKE